MIGAEAFVEALRRAGFGLFSGTPCSYLTPLINTVIDATGLRYVGAANEGEAVAIACGSELGGVPAVVLFQNSGLGNAVNPLTSLAATLRIPLLLITTWRGQPEGPTDEPQHELMGRITPRLLDLLDIPWQLLPDEEAAISAVVERACTHLRTQRTPYGLIMREGTVRPHALQTRPQLTRGFPVRPLPPAAVEMSPLDQDEALRAVRAGARPGDALIATTGYTGRALYSLGDRPNQLYMVGSMGCASSLGLGLALAQPRRRVVVLDGDGAFLMHMGAAAVLGHERPRNLVHVLLDNGVHDSTGGQATVSTTADLAAVARACGYPRVLRATGAAALEAALRDGEEVLTFIHLRTRPRTNRKLPRPELTPAETAERFRHWLLET
jgi:phosphonopyruvate decarboxylase